MIKSFKDKWTEELFRAERSKRFPGTIHRTGFRKLRMLHNAVAVGDLRSPPGNHLEALCGDREGQYSIRINDQWRICFVWDGRDALDVEICDYH